jgi:hypothetical protein
VHRLQANRNTLKPCRRSYRTRCCKNGADVPRTGNPRSQSVTLKTGWKPWNLWMICIGIISGYGIYIYNIYVCVSYNIYKYHLEWMYIYSFFGGDIIYNCYTGYTSDFIWIMWPHVVRSLAWWWMDSRNTLGPLGLCCFILTIFRLVTYFNSASGNGSWESANTCDPRN